MKQTLLFGIIVLLFSCSQKEKFLLGVWKVNSKFYKATCKIIEEEGMIKGVVLYYNDDTTIYSYKDGQSKHYFFNNLKAKNDHYIDAISGATNTTTETTTVNVVHKDTIEVTSYIMHKPIKEYWIRTSTD